MATDLPRPALGKLGIVPLNDDDPPATLEDARWLADVLAFDHDAPVGIAPAWAGTFPDRYPVDPEATAPVAPIGATADSWTTGSYWESLNTSYGMAAELRFSGSYLIRYHDGESPPSTDFGVRFAGREERVVLYAMAARQADLLAEYLCLYRLLEAGDGDNGKKFSAAHLAAIETADFGELMIAPEHILEPDEDDLINAFEIYRDRAIAERERLGAHGVSELAGKIRNLLAHGRRDSVTPSDAAGFETAARALPIVKLLARLAVEQ